MGTNDDEPGWVGGEDKGRARFEDSPVNARTWDRMREDQAKARADREAALARQERRLAMRRVLVLVVLIAGGAAGCWWGWPAFQAWRRAAAKPAAPDLQTTAKEKADDANVPEAIRIRRRAQAAADEVLSMEDLGPATDEELQKEEVEFAALLQTWATEDAARQQAQQTQQAPSPVDQAEMAKRRTELVRRRDEHRAAADRIIHTRAVYERTVQRIRAILAVARDLPSDIRLKLEADIATAERHHRDYYRDLDFRLTLIRAAEVGLAKMDRTYQSILPRPAVVFRPDDPAPKVIFHSGLTADQKASRLEDIRDYVKAPMER